MDNELLESFIVEAGEIIELLQVQLLDLERDASDRDLLNAIFRGFHTVKGGAGFLHIAPLVECCHSAENVFDILRKGEREATPALIDVVLRVVDAVVDMFAAVRDRATVMPADAQLLAELATYARRDVPAGAAPSAPPTAAEIKKPAGVPVTLDGDPNADMSDAEFDAILDQLHGKDGKVGVVEAAGPSTSSDEMSDAEFEAMLDELHGKGGKVGARANDVAPPVVVVAPAPVSAAPAQTPRAPTRPARGAADAAPAAKSEADSTVRVDTKVLDDLMNIVGELVLVRNRLVRLGFATHDEELSKAVGNLDVVTADLQASVMKTRMQPIKKVFGRFPRVARDLARSLNKEVNLELAGEDTDLDKNLVEALADPLVHLVRNSVDHGIEMPDERERLGKPRVGRILLAAEQEGDRIKLTISDDGKGMDPNFLRRKAVEKGLLEADAAERLTDTECYELIFAPGFSTKEQISETSGRGVGMDVVKTRIEQLNGAISIQSELGVGSRIVIKVPLTLAIMPTLMIMLADQPFALPLASVVEIFTLDLGRTNMVDGKEVVILRDRPVPLYHLRRWLMPTTNGCKTGKGHVVIVSADTQRIGLVVDQLIGQEEVVIKPLGSMLQGTVGLSGATITGDGRVALILDVPSMIREYA